MPDDPAPITQTFWAAAMPEIYEEVHPWGP